MNCISETAPVASVTTTNVSAEDIGAALTEQVPAFGENVR